MFFGVLDASICNQITQNDKMTTERAESWPRWPDPSRPAPHGRPYAKSSSDGSKRSEGVSTSGGSSSVSGGSGGSCPGATSVGPASPTMLGSSVPTPEPRSRSRMECSCPPDSSLGSSLCVTHRTLPTGGRHVCQIGSPEPRLLLSIGTPPWSDMATPRWPPSLTATRSSSSGPRMGLAVDTNGDQLSGRLSSCTSADSG